LRTALRAEGGSEDEMQEVLGAEIVEMIETMSFTTAHTKIVGALAIEPDP
jgi:hypothetical protein